MFCRSVVKIRAAALMLCCAALTAGCAPEPSTSPTSPQTPSTGAPLSSQTPSAPLASPTPLPTDSVDGDDDRSRVDVVLAAWQVTESGIEASAYVAGVVEEGGTCVLSAQQEDTVLQVRGGATPTGQNVSCGFLTVPAAELGAGEWQIWFEYSSPASFGVSGAVVLEAPRG